jgi:diguanylate cyclase (GGDEF)-like protein
MAFFDAWSSLVWSLAIAGVGLAAFLIGRRVGWTRLRPVTGRSDIARALAVAQELDGIADRLRGALSTHVPAVSHFQRKIERMEQSANGTVQEVFDRADELLKPTLRLGTEISHAYEEVLRQMTQLVALADLRSDPLTGTGNRRALDESLDSLIKDQVRYPATFSLALVDIDQGQGAGDEQRHLQGDRSLQQVAEILQSNVRQCDFVARIADKNFAVLMPRTELQGACKLSERVRADIARKLPFTVSIGLAASTHGDDAAAIIARADRALHAARQAGQDRVFLHDSDNDQLVGIRTTHGSDLATEHDDRSSVEGDWGVAAASGQVVGYPTGSLS